jgi:hypothetical protein
LGGEWFPSLFVFSYFHSVLFLSLDYSETNKIKEEGEYRERKRSRRKKKKKFKKRVLRKTAERDVGWSKSKPDSQTLKEGMQQQKKSPVQGQWNFSLSSSAVTPLSSRPVCVS